MEFSVILLALAIICTIVGGGIAGIVALCRVASLRNDLNNMQRTLESVQSRLGKLWGTTSQAPQASESSAAPIATKPAEKPQSEVCTELPASPPPLPMQTKPQIAASLTPAAIRPEFLKLPSPQAPAETDMKNLESQIGQRWIAWIGAIVVFFSAAFFLKHAFDNNWIGLTGQVVICAIVGLTMLVCGSRFIAKCWRTLGQSLMGLGLAILYATFFAAISLYESPVMSHSAAFAFMVAVTVAGMALAVMYNAPTISFLAVLGGLLTPVLVSTGQDAHDALFTYLLLLDLGVLGVAFFRNWRLLDTLTMVGTFALYFGWYDKFYQPELLCPALAWLGAFYVVMLILPSIYHLIRKQSFTIERFVMTLGNAAFAAGFAWQMLHEKYLFSMGFVVLGMAVAYLTLGAMIRRRLPSDAQALFGSIAMTVTFLTLAVPMQLSANGIMLAWVAEAPVLAYLAYRFNYRPLRAFAAVVLILATGRLFLYPTHWPMHTGLFIPFINRQFISAMAVPAAAALYALIHHRFRSKASEYDRGMQIAAALGAGLIALIILHAEIGGWMNNDFGTYAANRALAILWAVGALFYLLSATRVRLTELLTWGVGIGTLSVSAIMCIIAYNHTIGSEHVLFVNTRFAVGLLVLLPLFSYAGIINQRPQAGKEVAGVLASASFIAGIVALLILLSTEVYGYCVDTISDYDNAHRAGQMSITLVWSLYATGLLFVGFAKRWRAIRLGGLALFGAAALKLVVIDLTHLEDVYRIVAFLVLGLLMLGASYLYHRLEKRLGEPQNRPSQENDQSVAGEQK